MSSLELMQTAVKVKSSLTSIGQSPVDSSDPSNIKGEDTDSLVTSLRNSWLFTLALAAIAAAVVSMVGTVSTLVDVASLSLLVLAPLTVYQKHHIAALGGQRAQHNELRGAVNDLSTENNKLTTSVNSLQSNVEELQTVEKDLDTIALKLGGQTDRVVEIIRENGELQAKIKKSLEAQVLQMVLSTAMKSDRNADFSFSKGELRRLRLSLSEIPGVTFDKDNFDKMVGERDLTLSDIMRMFRNLKDDIPEEDNIFHLTPEKLLKRGLFS